MPPFEVIVVDDGSTDQSVAVVQTFGTQVKLIRQANQGCAAARNAGLRAATGRFVAFLDQDDFWHSRMIEEQVSALSRHPKAVASYTQCTDAPGFFSFGPYPPPEVSEDEFLLMLWYHAFFPPSAVMARRDAIEKVGPFRGDLECEDIEMWLRLLAVGRFIQVTQPLCYYRLHEEQFTKDVYRNFIGGKKARGAMIDMHADRLIRAGLPKDRLWDAYRNEILLVYFRRQLAAARLLLWDFWKDHPGDMTILRYAVASLLPGALLRRLRGAVPLDRAPAHGVADSTAWKALYERIPLTTDVA